MSDSAIDQDDDPGADLVGEDEDREQCRHGVSWNDPCERCEDEEWDAETAEMLDDEDDDEAPLLCPADSHDMVNECGVGTEEWPDGRRMCACHDDEDGDG